MANVPVGLLSVTQMKLLLWNLRRADAAVTARPYSSPAGLGAVSLRYCFPKAELPGVSAGHALLFRYLRPTRAWY